MTDRGLMRRRIGTALGLAFGLFPPLAAAGQDLAGEAAEKFLRTAAVVGVEKDAQSGRTLPWLVTLEKNGRSMRAVFKYVHRPRPHPLAHSYRYELAAYELSKILGLVIVPPTVERTVDGVRGALQVYAEDCISEHDLERSDRTPPDPGDLRERLDSIRLFEALSGDACGDKDDTLIHTDTWRVCRVDFAEAFPLSPELSEDCALERCPRSLYQRMRQMEPASTRRKLRSWLSRAEVEALCGRKSRILALLDEKIRARGEAAVLFAPAP